MSILHEGLHTRVGEETAFRQAGTKPRLSEEEKRRRFEEGKKQGLITKLTPNQRFILQLRGYFEEGPLRPFRGLEAELEVLKITYQAAHEREKGGLRRLTNRNGSRMTQEEERVILEHPDLPSTQLGEMLGRGENTISRYKDLVGVTRRPGGRPKIEMSPEIRNMMLQDRNLSADAHSRMVGRTDEVVVRWRGELGIGKSPVGRPRKSEPSS